MLANRNSNTLLLRHDSVANPEVTYTEFVKQTADKTPDEIFDILDSNGDNELTSRDVSARAMHRVRYFGKSRGGQGDSTPASEILRVGREEFKKFIVTNGEPAQKHYTPSPPLWALFGGTTPAQELGISLLEFFKIVDVSSSGALANYHVYLTISRTLFLLPLIRELRWT